MTANQKRAAARKAAKATAAKVVEVEKTIVIVKPDALVLTALYMVVASLDSSAAHIYQRAMGMTARAMRSLRTISLPLVRRMECGRSPDSLAFTVRQSCGPVIVECVNTGESRTSRSYWLAIPAGVVEPFSSIVNAPMWHVTEGLKEFDNPLFAPSTSLTAKKVVSAMQETLVTMVEHSIAYDAAGLWERILRVYNKAKGRGEKRQTMAHDIDHVELGLIVSHIVGKGLCDLSIYSEVVALAHKAGFAVSVPVVPQAPVKASEVPPTA